MPTGIMTGGGITRSGSLSTRPRSRVGRGRWHPVHRRRGIRGVGDYDDLKAKGGIFRHGGPHYPYQDLSTRAYNDGSLGQEGELPDLSQQVRRLTIVVGGTGLLVAGILFTLMLDRSQRA